VSLNFALDLSTTDFQGSTPKHILLDNSTNITPIGGATFASFVSYVGLPVIGFAVESYSNGTTTGPIATPFAEPVLSNYGGNFVHKGTRLIVEQLP
jgi:hypothetical protein